MELRSRGLSETQVILQHALPNALLPVLTIAGITVASLIGGALLIEVTFARHRLRLQESINQRDYPVVQGIVVVAALVVLVSVAVDLRRSARSTRALLKTLETEFEQSEDFHQRFTAI